MTNSPVPPLVSIITVVYNAGELVAPTIEAVAGLDYPAIEHIVVDGASTDGTLGVIGRYRGKIARLLSEPDHGIYDAMNKGIALATGEYLWFLNAGDTPATANALNGLLRGEDKPDYIFGDTRLIEDDGTLRKLVRAPARLDWRAMTHGMQVSHQSFIARRAIAPMYDLRYRYIADQKWIIDILKASGQGLRVRQPLSNYLLGGLSYRRFGRFVAEKIRYSFAELHWARALWVSAEDIVKAAKFYAVRSVRSWISS